MNTKLERLLAEKRNLEWLKQRNCEEYDRHIRRIQEEIDKQPQPAAPDLNLKAVQP